MLLSKLLLCCDLIFKDFCFNIQGKDGGTLKLLVSDGKKVGVKRKKEKESENDSGDVYTDSKTFLKGTHSLNPHNDYCQHFVDTLHRPHNFIRDTGIADRFEEYPKLKELIRLKDEIIAERATPPM